MAKKDQIRIEIRYDKVRDKEMIDFIDKYGSTRAGFIKQALNIYKTQVESSGTQNTNDLTNTPAKDNTKKKKPILGDSFSSKDLGL